MGGLGSLGEAAFGRQSAVKKERRTEAPLQLRSVGFL